MSLVSHVCSSDTLVDPGGLLDACECQRERERERVVLARRHAPSLVMFVVILRTYLLRSRSHTLSSIAVFQAQLLQSEPLLLCPLV